MHLTNCLRVFLPFALLAASDLPASTNTHDQPAGPCSPPAAGGGEDAGVAEKQEGGRRREGEGGGDEGMTAEGNREGRKQEYEASDDGSDEEYGYGDHSDSEGAGEDVVDVFSSGLVREDVRVVTPIVCFSGASR